MAAGGSRFAALFSEEAEEEPAVTPAAPASADKASKPQADRKAQQPKRQQASEDEQQSQKRQQRQQVEQQPQRQGVDPRMHGLLGGRGSEGAFFAHRFAGGEKGKEKEKKQSEETQQEHGATQEAREEGQGEREGEDEGQEQMTLEEYFASQDSGKSGAKISQTAARRKVEMDTNQLESLRITKPEAEEDPALSVSSKKTPGKNKYNQKEAKKPGPNVLLTASAVHGSSGTSTSTSRGRGRGRGRSEGGRAPPQGNRSRGKPSPPPDPVKDEAAFPALK